MIALNLRRFIVTISAWTEAGCKNADNDPNADKGDDFKDGLPGWCNTKKAAAIFFWLAFGMYAHKQSSALLMPCLASWLASLILLILYWRSGKLHTGPRDPPFQRPDVDEEDEFDGQPDRDEESSYHQIPPVRTSMATAPTRYDNSSSPTSPFSDNNRYQPASSFAPAPAAARPSMDAYGAFSDPAPTGFGASPAGTPGYSPSGPPVLPEPDVGPRVSRTMQYADPYAAVRASLVGGQQNTPPSYESYTGYR